MPIRWDITVRELKGCPRVEHLIVRKLFPACAWLFFQGIAMADLPFKVLVYRYFFFSWLFKDVCKGNLYERSGAWQHNREQAKWLPTYLKRWFVIGLIMYLLGALCELLFNSPALSAFFFVPAAISVSVNSVIGALILGFKALSGPL